MSYFFFWAKYNKWAMDILRSGALEIIRIRIIYKYINDWMGESKLVIDLDRERDRPPRRRSGLYPRRSLRL